MRLLLIAAVLLLVGCKSDVEKCVEIEMESYFNYVQKNWKSANKTEKETNEYLQSKDFRLFNESEARLKCLRAAGGN